LFRDRLPSWGIVGSENLGFGHAALRALEVVGVRDLVVEIDLRWLGFGAKCRLTEAVIGRGLLRWLRVDFCEPGLTHRYGFLGDG
jgi:hypothetical protein